jgi:hypothetical protein
MDIQFLWSILYQIIHMYFSQLILLIAINIRLSIFMFYKIVGGILTLSSHDYLDMKLSLDIPHYILL